MWVLASLDSFVNTNGDYRATARSKTVSAGVGDGRLRLGRMPAREFRIDNFLQFSVTRLANYNA